MFDRIIDFGAYLAESFSIWIICSLLLFACIMYVLHGSIYSFHLEMLNRPNKFSKTPVVHMDSNKVKLDKILCYLAASFCLIVGCGLCTKIILYILGLAIMLLSGIVQVIVLVVLFVLVGCILIAFI